MWWISEIKRAKRLSQALVIQAWSCNFLKISCWVVLFASSLWVSWEVFVLHGYDWIHWVAKSWTTTAYPWLFRDSYPSLGTLWSAVVKSPKFLCTRYGCATAFPARSPCYLGSRAVVASSVLPEVSKKLYLPNTTFPLGSETDSGEELAGASLCSGTRSSTRFSVNPSNHSVMSRNRSPRADLLGLSLRVVAGRNVETTESCSNDAGDVCVVELEELVDEPGTKIGT